MIIETFSFPLDASFVSNPSSPTSPISPIDFDFFITPVDTPIFRCLLLDRVWHILTLLCEWGAELLTKVMQCFQSLQSNHPEEEMIEEAIQLTENELCQLFNLSIPYEEFRDKILNYHGKSKGQKVEEFTFNNYDFAAYSQIKKSNSTLVNNGQNELTAGIEVYNAIVDLYVKRFLNQHPQLDKDEYLSALRTIALIIAIKESWDLPIANKNFQYFLHHYLEIKTLQKMEIEFLKGMDWDISITELSSGLEDINLMDEEYGDEANDDDEQSLLLFQNE